ncbi:HMP-PP phosphatase [Lentilactobacillus sunkii]|uniref:HMP-PP phosphatase n=1 Tax=Lentilactobacillus sunkii TaxID=481719 RepID=A0A1E7XGG5_9LACO|nr:HAD-IIB family hydrolase [Lentilactobacillus sunkii]OFA12177.1 HMP-PP phosphatase [Lentilactobacillus sunkii]
MKIVFDVDGTISFDGKRISQAIVSRINRLTPNRHDLIFASARPIRDLLPIIQDFSKATLIGGNGSIVSCEGRIKVIRPIRNRDYEMLKQLIKEMQLDYIIDGQWNYASRVHQGSMILNQLDPDRLAQNVDLEAIKRPIKVILLNLSKQQIREIAIVLERQTELSIIEHHGENNIDLTAQGINKFTTFQKLFPKESYIAFGNDDNDRELLLHAFKSVWIGKQSGAIQAGIPQSDYCYPGNIDGALSGIDRIAKELGTLKW